MIADEALGLLTKIAALLDRLGVPYLVGGSIASTLFGEPRGTRDVDLVIELAHEGIEPLARALGADFYVSLSAMIEAVRDRRSFSAVDPVTGLKVDFFVKGDSDFDREEFARRRLESIVPGEPASVWVKTPEDSILRKLLWFRDSLGVADVQWRDVVGLLAMRNRQLDAAYLDTWGTRLGLSDLMHKARNDATR